MKIIIGLGNPGPNYIKSRHNLGFTAVDRLKTDLGLQGDWQNNETFKSAIIEGQLGSEKVILAKPQTMMNLSGQAAQALVNFYKTSPDDLWVIHDDLDLPLGILRISQGSSSAGHNGVNSIIENLGTKNFVRFRMGVHPIGQTFFTAFFKRLTSTKKFVLQRFTKEEQASVEQVLKKATEAIKLATTEGLEKSKNQFN